LQLPPSLNLGEEFVDQFTGTRFAQPRITYFLRAAVSFTTESHQDCQTLETFLPATIAPYTEELPPTATDDFPMEFKERESKVLRRSLMGGTLGTMNVSLKEPPALIYDTSSTSSSTTALMRLEFESTNVNLKDVLKSLQGLSFTVFSLVRVKTFYSVKSFPRLPSQTLLESFREMRLRDGILKLETQYVRDVSWGYRVSLDSRSNVSLASQLSLSISNKDGTRQASMISEPNGKWISNWTVPIEVNGRLLPTFCSSLVARFYTLIVRVKVTGARQEAFDLEVPLQVIHTPLGKTDLSTVEDIREQFLEHRIASEASWFSDDSLVSCFNATIGIRRLINLGIRAKPTPVLPMIDGGEGCIKVRLPTAGVSVTLTSDEYWRCGGSKIRLPAQSDRDDLQLFAAA
jgi:hypothetical protein